MSTQSNPVYIGSRKSGTDVEQFYKEALENASNFNSRMMSERKLRLPFLDSQTGVAQNNCFLWFQKRHRAQGQERGQLYTYPSRRWRKKRKNHQPVPVEIADSRILAEALGADLSDYSGEVPVETAINPEHDPTHSYGGITIHPVHQESEDILRHLEAVDVFPDAGEIDRPGSESDEDYEVSARKKKQKKGRGTGGGGGRRSRGGGGGGDVCKKRYKNRQGLSYHTQHTHQAELETSMEENDSQPSPLEPVADPRKHPVKNSMDLEATSVSAVTSASEDSLGEVSKSSKGGGGPETNNYCDFCLGDATENKKTQTPEDLISCSDCGRSGHPTCLQFTDTMIQKVKGYRWQCIECKSCGLCGTSDNDDQLLFCDDCDRGYHMYCLNPPMQAPPEGSWICDLCKV
ncbi:zinc finger protein ubi-d4 isoform X3 [Strongylocentrotus purpuratus]|uniref:PHD-type domain-containing protein n=1 Tax=Strongylocentrotus purpuratus TaxID=7668 RepID=A0A7M7LWI4_STRPU|nr:zinc finger protein ubi-d4 isoform X3 [Strongylocentrotus purpuratus]|eukprot:XP_011680112.1 PREDICTED: zinc finger protein ubi-d4 isoform X3 [Strongylocentrotus purpuratus]